MPQQLFAKLLKKEELKSDIFKFTVQAREIADIAKPGQFLEIRVNDQIEPFLRRPISIYNIEKQEGIIEFVFQVKGNGTEILSTKKEGELVDIMGPLGEGNFDYSKYNDIAIIGGGIGIFPLYELGKRAKNDGKNVNTYIGFRNKEFVILEKAFENISNNFCLSTDDGTYGKKGYAINFLKEDIKQGKIDAIFACGPLPMLKAVQALAEDENMPCQISLEERMGCGIGVCLGCAVKTKESSKENPEYVRICREGPVFDSSYVEI